MPPTTAAISFLSETLAPDSLETLFLQGAALRSVQVIELGRVFRGPIRRHRTSLRKLLLDSAWEEKGWRDWVLGQENVVYLTSEKMAGLKELTIFLHQRDWVRIAFFLKK